MNDEFVKCTARREKTKHNLSRSVGSLLFGYMSQAASLYQTVKFLGEIRCVISGALESLCHQKNFEAGSITLGDSFREMLLEQCVADAIDFLVHLQNGAGALEVQGREAPVNQVEHIPQNGRHLHQLANIRDGDLLASRLNPEGHTHHQVPDALEIGCRFEAGEELSSPAFIHACNGRGEALVDLPLNQVEFLFTVLDCKECHTR